MTAKHLTSIFVLTWIWIAAASEPAAAQWLHVDNQSDVRALCPDGDVLWVGTNGGLLLVDAATGEINAKYTSGAELPGNSVRVLRKFRGQLYVGTDEGLAVFSRNSDGSFSTEDMGGIRDVRDVSFDADGQMHVATFGQGVASAVGRGWRWVTRADSLLDDKVFAVYPAEAPDVYYATSMGLCAYLDSAWVSYQAGAGLPRGEVRDLVMSGEQVVGEDDDKTFFVLVAGRGVYRFRGGRARRILPARTFDENDVAAIALGGDDVLWACGRYGGIAKYDKGKWTGVGMDDDDIVSSRWRSAYADADGSAYFGSADGLIVTIQNEEIRKISVPSVLPSGHIGAIAENHQGYLFVASGPYVASSHQDTVLFNVEEEFGSVFAMEVAPDGALWVNGRWGMFRNENGRWAEVPIGIDAKQPFFVSIAFDSAGGLWAGSYSGEVYRNDGQLWARLADRYELSAGPIDRIVVDGGGRIWTVSASTGVFRFGGSAWETFGVDRFDPRGIRQLVVDADGRPVVVSADAIWRYGRGAWERIEAPEPTETGDFQVVCFDAEGRMYLGTSQGLAAVSGDGQRWWGPRDGLGGTNVASLFVDSRNNLWVGFGNDGLSRISLVNLW